MNESESVFSFSLGEPAEEDIEPVDAELDNQFGFTLRPDAPSLTGFDRIWEDLAVAAEFGESLPTGRELAECINGNIHVEQFTPAISSALHDTVELLTHSKQKDRAAARRLSELLVHLNPHILTAALRTEIMAQRRSTILEGSVEVLTIRAILRVAQAASRAYRAPFSRPFRHLLRKLARDAASGSPLIRADAQAIFRRILGRKFGEVRHRTEARVTVGYKDVFAKAPRRREAGKASPEADRVIQTALEVDAMGETVWVTLSEMIGDKRQRELAHMVTEAPSRGQVAEVIIGRLAHPDLLGALLKEEPLDLGAVDLLLDHMGFAATKVLLEELAESRSRATRREVFHRLVKLGPDIGPLVEHRLKDRRWFVLRNMLALAREAGCLIDWHLMEPYLEHVDARVRREALLLLLRHDITTDQAITRSLEDADRNVLRTALQAARTRLPDGAVPVLAERITAVDFPPEFRVMVLHLLGKSRSQIALDALLRFAQSGRTILGRPKLASKSPEMLAALSNLARTWPGERRAAALLVAARNSKDEQITAAADTRAIA